MSEKSPKLKRAKLDIEDISSNPDSSPVITHESSLSEEAYYNENFKFIINYVLESVDGHVISAEERMFVQRFLDLNRDSQQLFVRLFLRKHQWLRSMKISYPEISTDINMLITDLVDNRLLWNESHLSDIEEALNLLQVPELKSLCKELNLPSSTIKKQKHDCINDVVKYCNQYKPLFTKLTPVQLILKKCKSYISSCVMISSDSINVFSRIMLLFSLVITDIDEDTGPQRIIYHMLEVKIGRRIYPHYDVIINKPLFTSREDFDRYYEAYQLQQKIINLLENKQFSEEELELVTTLAQTGLDYELKRYKDSHLTSEDSQRVSRSHDDDINCDSNETDDVIDLTRDYTDDVTNVDYTSQSHQIISDSHIQNVSKESSLTDIHSPKPSSTSQANIHNPKLSSTPLKNDPLNPRLFTSSSHNNTPIPIPLNSQSHISISRSVDSTQVTAAKPSLQIHMPTPSSSFQIVYTSGWVYTSVLTYCLEGWEKLKEYGKANEIAEILLDQKLYCEHKRGHWLDRYTLNLDYHLGDKNKCLSIIKQSLQDTYYLHDSRRLSLLQRAHKLCQQTTGNKKNRRIKYLVSDFPPIDLVEHKEIEITGQQHPTSCLFITKGPQESATFLPVEGYAVHYYTTVEGWPKAVHSEGGTFSTFYVLLMWDIIYSSHIPDVFRGPFQSMPLDFGREWFYNSRREQIETRLKWIRNSTDEELVLEISSVWDKHYGEMCVGINWEMFTCEDIKCLISCMGGLLLYRVCDIFSHSYYHNRGGLPDLTLWNSVEKRCKFVEVKGPGDRLSHKQSVWLSTLTQWNCEAEVCRVKGYKNRNG